MSATPPEKSHSYRRLLPRRRNRPGQPPGTVAVDPAAATPSVTVIAYERHSWDQATIHRPEELRPWLDRSGVIWVNVDGLGDAATISAIGALFGCHPLALEDVVNVHQRSKIEQYDDRLFICTRMPLTGDYEQTEQISMFLGPNFVLTFQEKTGGDCLGPVRARIENSHSRLRTGGADYLAYAVLDTVIDQYFPRMEFYAEKLETVEEQIWLNRPNQNIVVQLHELRHLLALMHRIVRPLRETISALMRIDTALIADETRLYLRDCYDHVNQLIDLIDSHREVGATLMEGYLSALSLRSNEVMKVLTVIATIFIPLTFIAGVYGMNFNSQISPFNMPELHWYWGYPFALALMSLTAGGLMYFFARKGWITSRPQSRKPRR